MMSPSPPQHAAEAAQPERPTPPPPMPAASALHYAAATLAFADPSIDGSTPASGQVVGRTTSAPPAPVAAVPSGQQEAKPSDSAAARQPTQEAQQAPSAKQPSAAADAYAKARDSDLKHTADKRRSARAQRWADRHRRDADQDSDDASQQARDDRNSDGAPRYSYDYSDRRYRDQRSSRYREPVGGDDRAAPYDVDEAPSFGIPRIQLFGPDD
jgi:hypothetical protein